MALLDSGRSRAVLIGTATYRDDELPDLPAVKRSVMDLADVLSDPLTGILPRRHQTVLLDEGDLRELGRRLRSAVSEAEDLLIVFYAGHGLVGGKRHDLYLALPDSEWQAPEFNSLEYDKLRAAVLDSPAKNKVLILDCCFSGRALEGMMADPATAVLGQLDVQGTYVLTSAQRNQVALALPGEDHTAFTGRLIGLLRDGVKDGPEFLSIESLYLKLRSIMVADGLPLPEKRATRTAEFVVLGRNRAYVSAAGRASNGLEAAIGGTPTPEVERADSRWDAFRTDRGNRDGACVTFDAHKGLYWVLTSLVAVLSAMMTAVAVVSSASVTLRIIVGVAAAFSAAVGVGFGVMARSPVRLEIGEAGIQLFARSGTTWLPWNVLERVAVRRRGGSHHIVAWLREAEIFPDFDTFGGGPRYLQDSGAVAVCSISTLRVARHEIVRALMYYGGSRFDARTADGPRPPIDMSADWWGDALDVAHRVETDRRQRAVDRHFAEPDQAVLARDALARELRGTAAGRSAAPHVVPWVWTTASGGRPLTEHGRQTGVELRLSYYSRPPEAGWHQPDPLPQPASLPAGPIRHRPRRMMWRILLGAWCISSAIMTMGAVGATVTRGFPSVAGAVAGNVIFESMLIGSIVLLMRELRWSSRNK